METNAPTEHGAMLGCRWRANMWFCSFDIAVDVWNPACSNVHIYGCVCIHICVYAYVEMYMYKYNSMAN